MKKIFNYLILILLTIVFIGSMFTKDYIYCIIACLLLIIFILEQILSKLKK